MRAFIALFALTALLQQPPRPSVIQDGDSHGDPPYMLEEGWEPLLNGQDLAGWRSCDPGAKNEGEGIGDILSMLNMDDASADVPTIPMPLAHSLPWPDLPRIFDQRGFTSYWWTNTGAGGPLRGFTTDVGLAPSLMLTLMRPQFGGARRQ